MKADENPQETGQVAGATPMILADPHQKGPLTTPVGRLIERASYLDLALAGAFTILLSTAYFSIAPGNHALGERSKGVLDAAYFSVVTFTSLGYGDLSPQGFGRVIAIIVVLVGLALIALLVGKFASERQHSLLLLLHTSDCQRRLNEFTNELASLTERLAIATRSANVADTQTAAKALSDRVEVVGNYLVFNANQARLIEFGNESSLLALYDQLSKIQRFCLGVHKAEASDLLVSRRTRSISRRCLGLVCLMRTFHDHAEQKTSYLGALFKLAARIGRMAQPTVPSSLSKRIVRIHDAMAIEDKVLESWSHGARTPIVVEEVWLRSPVGEPSTWPKGVHKVIAKSLSISNRLAQACIDELLKSGRLPK